jgi:hypothetical protein
MPAQRILLYSVAKVGTKRQCGFSSTSWRRAGFIRSAPRLLPSRGYDPKRKRLYHILEGSITPCECIYAAHRVVYRIGYPRDGRHTLVECDPKACAAKEATGHRRAEIVHRAVAERNRFSRRSARHEATWLAVQSPVRPGNTRGVRDLLERPILTISGSVAIRQARLYRLLSLGRRLTRQIRFASQASFGSVACAMHNSVPIAPGGSSEM